MEGVSGDHRLDRRCGLPQYAVENSRGVTVNTGICDDDVHEEEVPGWFQSIHLSTESRLHRQAWPREGLQAPGRLWLAALMLPRCSRRSRRNGIPCRSRLA